MSAIWWVLFLFLVLKASEIKSIAYYDHQDDNFINECDNEDEANNTLYDRWNKRDKTNSFERLCFHLAFALPHHLATPEC